MKYKALMLDVDGTTIPNQRNGMPSKKVTTAIHKANKKLIVGLASGRPYEALHHIADHLQLTGPLIVNGGAKVIDPKTKKILWQQIINPEDVEAIGTIMTQMNVDCYLYDEGDDVQFTKNYLPRKVLQMYGQSLDPELAKRVVKNLSHIKTISIHTTVAWTPGKTDILINHVNATKQYGIMEFAKILKINTHEIIGVGDGNNDFPLLMACGLKVAMGNAGDDLKAIADYVAPTVGDDGVADVIEKFIMSKSA